MACLSTDSAQYLGIAISTVAFTRNEKVKLSGYVHLWEHLMPNIGQDDDETPNEWW